LKSEREIDAIVFLKMFLNLNPSPFKKQEKFPLIAMISQQDLLRQRIVENK